MTHYVLGFLFSANMDLVWLLWKARGPARIVGRYTGLGGKVEPGESLPEAMRREGLEEAGVDCDWVSFGSMGDNETWHCGLFYADGTNLNPKSCDPTEPGNYARRDSIRDLNTAENIRALIELAEMALNSERLLDVRLNYRPEETSHTGD